MLSKRSIILDSLSTHRIDEGMIDSISKNSSSGSGDKLLSDVYGIADTSYILKDTKEVLGALFKSSVGLLSHLVDISPNSHYMSNSFIRYEFDSKETALSCFKELESGKYSSVDDALNTTYDIIMTYNGKDVERHVGTESGKASASAGARVVSALQSVFDEWVNTEYGKSDKKTIMSNVYRIADDLLLIEFKYMKLPVCLLVTFNNGDSFDVACDKLEMAFNSPVDRARDVISNLTSYDLVGTTYNTTKGNGTFCVEASEVIESFLYWYYKSESNKGVKRCCIDSELYKYVTITGIIFKNLCFGNTSDLQIDVVCSINSGDDSKVHDLLDTLNTPMNMFAHVNSGSLIISLLLKS